MKQTSFVFREILPPDQIVDSGSRFKEICHAVGGENLQNRLAGQGFVHPCQHITDENFDFLTGIQSARFHTGGESIVIHQFAYVLSGFGSLSMNIGPQRELNITIAYPAQKRKR